MKIKLILFVLVLVLVCSCKRDLLPDEEFTMIRTPYSGNEIRLDGYYFEFLPSYNIYSNLIFYRNGIVLSFDYTSKIKDFYNDNKLIESVRKDKGSWGMYIVRNDTVMIEQKTLDIENTKYIVINFQKKILNDTTLSFTNKNGDVYLYHFKKFSPKPDSTNVFIK